MRRKITVFGIIAAFLVLNSTVFGTDRLVPSVYPTIQAAIDDCNNGDTVIVADGNYIGADNKNLDFGGLELTVRSENGAGVTIINCQNSGRGFYFHSGEDSNSVVEGFTIKNGKAHLYGGGIYCTGSSPTIRACVVTNNQAYGNNSETTAESAYGGGIYCESGSNATITSCTISSNTAQGGHGIDEWAEPPPSGIIHGPGDGGAAYGGGIYGSADSSLSIDSCNIKSNKARGGDGGESEFENSTGGSAYGGGIYGKVTVSNATISSNQARSGASWTGSGNWAARGGGIYCLSSSVVRNCLIVGNNARYGWGTSSVSVGGAIYGGVMQVLNCTIVNNQANYDPTGPPIIKKGGVGGSGSSTITDCIVWDNGDDLIGCSATYSCIKDSDAGTGNIHSDPCFVSGPWGDYYLSQIAAGQASNSPCVNLGSATAVSLGMDNLTTRTDHGADEATVDMGYHSLRNNPADFDGDLDVDADDFAILGYQWQQGPGVPSADIWPVGGDGIVDENDLRLLVENWATQQYDVIIQ